MNPDKVQNVLSMVAEDRFAYFLRKIVDLECVWGLYNNGWAMAADDSGKRVIPFWPEAEFASLCRTDEWATYEPRSITLSDFVENWIPGMRKDGVAVAAFPKPSDRGIVVDCEALRQAITLESSQYE